MPDTIHFDLRGKRTTATLNVGNLEFKASTKDLKEALDREFHKIQVENVVSRDRTADLAVMCFATLSWAQVSKVDPSDICTIIWGCYMSSHDRYTSVGWTARSILHHQMIVFRQNTSITWIR